LRDPKVTKKNGVRAWREIGRKKKKRMKKIRKASLQLLKWSSFLRIRPRREETGRRSSGPWERRGAI